MFRILADENVPVNKYFLLLFFLLLFFSLGCTCTVYYDETSNYNTGESDNIENKRAGAVMKKYSHCFIMIFYGIIVQVGDGDANLYGCVLS